MITEIPQLCESQRKKLAGLVTDIVKVIAPEKIICFGNHITVTQDWGCFFAGNDCKEYMGSRFYFLIITNDNKKPADHEIVQIIEQLASPWGCCVTSIVHNLVSVNNAIEKGSRFFTTLYHSGVLLYDGNSLPLITPPDNSSVAIIKDKIEQVWNREFVMAQRFYHTASYCLSHEWYELCVFMLHQSVQHGCMALLKAFMGYRSETHNLARLLALTETFSLAPSSIFPRVTKEEVELFNLLLNAYSDADTMKITP